MADERDPNEPWFDEPALANPQPRIYIPPPSPAKIAKSAGTIVLAIALIAFNRAEISYFFASTEPEPLGSAEALRGTPRDNLFARITGSPAPKELLEATRPLIGTRLIFRLQGGSILVAVPPGTEIPVRFAGRGRLRSLAHRSLSPLLKRWRDDFGHDLGTHAFLLEASDLPRGHWPYALLCLVFLTIALQNLWQLVRPGIHNRRNRIRP